MKKIRKAILKWLLKDEYLGFSIENNTLTNNKLDNCNIHLIAAGNIRLDKVDLPKNVKLIIETIDENSYLCEN